MFPVWDAELLLWIQEISESPILDRFFVFFTALGDHGYLWIGTGVVLLCFKKTRVSGLLLLVALLCTHLLNNLVLKELINRPRPYEAMDMVRLLLDPQPETSFPSGHSATAFGSAFVLVIREKAWLRWIPFGAAVLMAFSRVYVGVHYPIDIAAGALVGILVAFLVCAVAKVIQDRRSDTIATRRNA